MSINWTDLEPNHHRYSQGKYKLTQAQHQEIYDLYVNHQTGKHGATPMAQLARDYNVSVSAIRNAIEREQIRRTTYEQAHSEQGQDQSHQP